MKSKAPISASLLHDESGQDLIEYALIAALIGLGAIASLKSVTQGVANVFTAVGNTFTSAF